MPHDDVHQVACPAAQLQETKDEQTNWFLVFGWQFKWCCLCSHAVTNCKDSWTLELADRPELVQSSPADVSFCSVFSLTRPALYGLDEDAAWAQLNLSLCIHRIITARTSHRLFVAKKKKKHLNNNFLKTEHGDSFLCILLVNIIWHVPL